MASKALPSPEVLRQLLRYEPETGKLFWLPRPLEMFTNGTRDAAWACNAWNARHAEKEAFTIAALGYNAGGVWRTRMLAHRVIWAMVTGAWPRDFIDHINGVGTDNRWCNLREATTSQNHCNKRIQSNNTSGFKGVSLHKKSKLWHASIAINGEVTSLGYFHRAEDAGDARKKAAIVIHGEFARLS